MSDDSVIINEDVKYMPKFRTEKEEADYYEMVYRLNPNKKEFDKIDMNDVTIFGDKIESNMMVATGCYSDNGKYLLAMLGTNGEAVSTTEYYTRQGLRYNDDEEFGGWYDPNNINDYSHPRNPAHRRSTLERVMHNLFR